MQDRYIINDRMRKMTMFISVFMTVITTGIFLWNAELKVKAQIQEQLAGEVLRLHVLANSDSEKDQALKLKVRDEILLYMKENMPDTEYVEEVTDWVRKNSRKLEEIGAEVISKEGYHYPVSAALTTCWFPEKSYGDVTFPQGNYKALRIEIGEAKGENWWCVLYPELCFMNAVHAVVPEEGKKQLKNVLTEDEYACVTIGSEFQLALYFTENLLTFWE